MGYNAALGLSHLVGGSTILAAAGLIMGAC